MKKLNQAKLSIRLAAVLCLAFAVCALAVSESATEENKTVIESIWTATKVGDIKTIKEHLNEGMNVNTRDDEGNAPLHIATLFGQTEIMKLLIQEGADVNISNNDSATPLHTAAFFGQAEAAEILIQNGADVNARHSDGAVPLDLTKLDWATTQTVASSLEIELDEEKVKASRIKVASILRQQAAKKGSEEKPTTKEGSPEEVIEQMIRESIAYANTRNARELAKDIHPTRYSVFGDAPQGELAYLSKEDLIGLLQMAFSFVVSISISEPIDLEIWVHGDAAFATYLVKTEAGKKSATIRHTDIFYRIDGVWQLVHSHQSHLIQ
jgi:hypothetical protein